MQYATLSSFQKRTAFKIQSIFLCMFDIYDGYQGQELENGIWEAELDRLGENLGLALADWNPIFSDQGNPGNFHIREQMRENSDNIRDIFFLTNMNFFRYMARKFEMPKIKNALEVACTVGSWFF